jgi:TPR repeat protein
MAALLAFAPGAPAGAQERVALVIGNSKYEHAGVLKNPVNDASDMAAALRKLGFQVIEGIDLSGGGMKARIREFSDKLANARVALFYYAGHGLQVDGRNYLVPTDARLKKPSDVELDAVDVKVVLRQMESFERINLVFLDACRNNPLAETLARSLARGRSITVGKGLAVEQSGIGMLIAFATAPEAEADDGGDDRNSPFTRALLRHIGTPGLDISLMMRRVRGDVIKSTKGKQVPWDHSSLTESDTVMLVPPPPPAQVGGLPPAESPRPPKTATEPRISTALDLEAECDELAAFRTDLDRPAASKWQDDYSSIPIGKAFDVCQRALDNARGEKSKRRMLLQIGRIHAAQGREQAVSRGDHTAAQRAFDRAVEFWTRAADMNSGHAHNVLGAFAQGSFAIDTARGTFSPAKPDFAAALKHYLRAADLGNPNGLTNAGLALIGVDDRFGNVIDHRKGRIYLEQARKLGVATAYYGIGSAKMLGLGYEKNESDGIRYFSVAFCKGERNAVSFFAKNPGYPRPACVGGEFVESTAPVAQRPAPAAAASRASGEACDRLAANPNDRRKSVAHEGVPYAVLKLQADEAIAACEVAVRQNPGELRLQYQLGRALQFKDRRRAFDIHRRLAALNYPAAYDNLGWLYYSEFGNPSEAVAQFVAGTRLEDPDSMVSLGEMVDRGHFTPANPNEAKLFLFKRAAELGHPNAARAYELEIALVEESRQREANKQEMQRQMLQFFATVLGGIARR